MRLSSKPADPGFARFIALRQLGMLPVLRVFLDGQQIRQALIVTCDDEEGFIEVRQVDHRGKVIDLLVTRRLEGKVVIKVGKMERA